MNIQLPIELVNQIIMYMAKRPYEEVYAMIDGIKEAAKPKEVENGDQVDSKGG